MRRFSPAFRRLVDAFRPGRPDGDLEDELRDHLAREEQRQLREGAPSVEEAHRLALLRSGNLRSAQEAVRDARPGSVAADALADLRFGWRGVRRDPGFAAAVIVSLALGVGGTTAMYSIVHGVLVRELPYPAAERLFNVRVWWNDFSATLSPADYLAVQEQIGGMGRAGAYSVTADGFTMSTREGPQVVDGGSMTMELPAVLGVQPILGAGFSADRRADEVLLGETLWRRHFNGSPDAIGQAVVLDGEPYTVAGVMPNGFNLPGERNGAAWIKLRLDTPTRRGPFFLRTVVRVPPTVAVDGVAADLTRAVSTVLHDRYGVDPQWRYGLQPLKDTIVGDIKPTLTLLLGAMGLVLLIAIVNVSGLLLARGTVRMREMAVRASLGAGRSRLARQVIVESALLGGLGGLLGFGLAGLFLSEAARRAERIVPRMHEVAIDGTAAAFALTCGMLAGVLAGVLPALRLPWRHLLTSLRDAGRTASAGPGYGRARQALVVAEVALTVMIVTGAMLLAKSLFRLQAVNPGFHAEGVLTFRLSLPAIPYETDERRAAFFASLEERLRALPGVSSTAYAMALPPDLLPMSNNYTVEGSSTGSQGASGVAEWTVVSPRYFDAMGIRLLAGRAFAAADGSGSPPVAIVNETYVRRHYPDGQALGKRLKGGDWDASRPWVTIVGLVADVPYGKGLGGGADATVYRPYAQNLWWRSPFVVVKAAGDPGRLVAPIREAVASIDPNLPLRDVATMQERLRTSLLEPRARSLLLALLGGLATALAVTGIYGVMSYHVSQRRREIAIRRVLGAPASQVVRGSVASGLRLTAAGIGLGVAGALLTGRTLAAVLYSVNPRDPLVLLSVVGVLSGCALLACAVPTMRAVRLDPASVLRDE